MKKWVVINENVRTLLLMHFFMFHHKFMDFKLKFNGVVIIFYCRRLVCHFGLGFSTDLLII